jgi:hypothetical protein
MCSITRESGADVGVISSEVADVSEDNVSGLELRVTAIMTAE